MSLSISRRNQLIEILNAYGSPRIPPKKVQAGLKVIKRHPDVKKYQDLINLFEKVESIREQADLKIKSVKDEVRRKHPEQLKSLENDLGAGSFFNFGEREREQYIPDLVYKVKEGVLQALGSAIRPWSKKNEENRYVGYHRSEAATPIAEIDLRSKEDIAVLSVIEETKALIEVLMTEREIVETIREAQARVASLRGKKR